jgi:hypothetical protein
MAAAAMVAAMAAVGLAAVLPLLLLGSVCWLMGWLPRVTCYLLF